MIAAPGKVAERSTRESKVQSFKNALDTLRDVAVLAIDLIETA